MGSGRELWCYIGARLIPRPVAAAEWKLDVTITQRRDGDNNLGIIAVQGPNARAKVWEVLPQAKSATEGLKAFFAAEVESKIHVVSAIVGLAP